MPQVPSLKRERLAWETGELLIGVDEAGRGPLAGPVVASAVVFPADCARPRSIRDSKTLSFAQRQVAAQRIRKSALAIGVGAASVREIDRLNIRVATIVAMRRAVRRVLPKIGPGRFVILLDGIAMPELGFDHEALVDGDALCLSVSAAGIIAKTVRDRLMASLAVRYDGYDWVTNRGYATEAHLRALDRRGPTPHHRQTFGPVAQLKLFSDDWLED